MEVKVINEERLFKLLPHFFKHPSTVLTELVQNAQRAGATRVDIKIDKKEGILEYSDNGRGVENHRVLFILADSGWTEEVEKNQEPAGWGLFFLYAISVRVTISSKFGSLQVNCNRYLTDKNYRKEILSQKPQPETCRGFKIRAKLKPEMIEKLYYCSEKLKYTQIDVYINGEPVKKASIFDLLGNGKKIKSTYMGNRVIINIDRIIQELTPHFLAQKTIVNWYGIPILSDYCHYASVAIEVKGKPPLTPQLPLREGIVEDDRLERFTRFVKNTVVRYCTEKINKADSSFNDLIEYMKCMSRIATQEEMDRLKYFYVEKTEPYFYKDPDDLGFREYVIVTEKDTLKIREIEQVVFKGGNKTKTIKQEDLDIVLPEGRLFSVQLPDGKIPSWLKTGTVKYTLVVESDRNRATEIDGYIWVKGKIYLKSKQEKISLDAVCVRWYNRDKQRYEEYFIYSKEPEDIWKGDLAIAYFHRWVYNDEGDTYSTQYNEYIEYLESTIRRINRKVNLRFLEEELLYFTDLNNVEKIIIDRIEKRLLAFRDSTPVLELAVE